MTLPSSASSVMGEGVAIFCLCCFRTCSLLADNVTLQIDGVLYLRVMDPYKVPSLLRRHSAQVKPCLVLHSSWH